LLYLTFLRIFVLVLSTSLLTLTTKAKSSTFLTDASRQTLSSPMWPAGRRSQLDYLKVLVEKGFSVGRNAFIRAAVGCVS